MAIEVDGKILLEVFSEYTGHDSFKKSSIFSSFPASFLSCSSRCSEEDVWLVQIFPSHLEFFDYLPHSTLDPLLPASLNQWTSSSH